MTPSVLFLLERPKSGYGIRSRFAYRPELVELMIQQTAGFIFRADTMHISHVRQGIHLRRYKR